MPVWDPRTYLEFADERSRPFVDLLSRVGAANPQVVVDLGCGPGQLTASLADRWPRAQILGLDSSPEMITQAEKLAGPRVKFQVQDLRDWRPEMPVDVIISNARCSGFQGTASYCRFSSHPSYSMVGWPFRCRETLTSPAISCFVSWLPIPATRRC